MRFECHLRRVASCQTERSLCSRRPARTRAREDNFPRVNSSFASARGAGGKEDTKGALTLSSGDKGPILGPHGVLTRQWERTLGEKYPGLRTDGIFSDEERRGVDTPKGTEEGRRRWGLSRRGRGGEGRICGKRGCNEAASQARI